MNLVSGTVVKIATRLFTSSNEQLIILEANRMSITPCKDLPRHLPCNIGTTMTLTHCGTNHYSEKVKYNERDILLVGNRKHTLESYPRQLFII